MSIVICRTPMREISREPDGRRWCFGCRARREFLYVVSEPVEQPSYYGPSQSVQCATCGLSDGDLFPGRYREWEGV